MQRKILVAGAQGVIGRAAASHLAAQPDTGVLGLSRRTEPSATNVEAISVDLLNPARVRESLGGVRDVTHIVFGAVLLAEPGRFDPGEPKDGERKSVLREEVVGEDLSVAALGVERPDVRLREPSQDPKSVENAKQNPTGIDKMNQRVGKA